MNLDLTPDQEALRDAVQRIAAPFAAAPSGDAYVLDGGELYAALEQEGFLEAARLEEFGPVGGVILLELAASLPFSVPLAGAALVAPLVTEATLAGPVALARLGDGSAVRHLTVARSVLIDAGDYVCVADAQALRPVPAPSVFPDSFGLVGEIDPSSLRVLDGVAPSRLRQWRSVALAAEIVGAASTAVARTVDYVKTRRQFGRPIGSYQAIQHRLAECEVLVHGTRALTYRAAASRDPAAAFLAATHAQTAAARIAYDTQQFHGATGLTRENELHFCTYRLRALQGELGVRTAPWDEAASLLWPRGSKPAAGTEPAGVP